MTFESPSGRQRPSEAPSKERMRGMHRDVELKEAGRGAMCESLARSAKKIATLAAFIGGMNGIAGCGAAVQKKEHSLDAFLHEQAAKVGLGEAHAGFPKTEKMFWDISTYKGPLQFLSRQKKREAASRAERESKRMTAFHGFEAFGVDQKLMEEYVTVAFPKTWRRHSNVASVSIDPHFVAMPYPGYENKPEYAHCRVPDDGSPAEVEITSERFKQGHVEDEMNGLLRDVLAHEFAHANDWSSSPDLSSQEALELGYLVMHAVTADGRPKFSYPEGIVPKEQGEAFQAKAIGERMTEYFAELVEDGIAYREAGMEKWRSWDEWTLLYGVHLQVELRADAVQAQHNARILQWYFSRIDPEFKPWQAAAKSDAIAARIRREQRESLFEKSFASIPDDPLREFAVDALRKKADGLSAEDLAFQDRVMNDMTARKDADVLPFSSLSKKLEALSRNQEERNVVTIWQTLVGEIVLAHRASSETVGRTLGSEFIKTLTDSFADEWQKLPADRQQVLRASMLHYTRTILQLHAPSKHVRTKK